MHRHTEGRKTKTKNVYILPSPVAPEICAEAEERERRNEQVMGERRAIISTSSQFMLSGDCDDSTTRSRSEVDPLASFPSEDFLSNRQRGRNKTLFIFKHAK